MENTAMDTRKTALLQALRTWINQRPGLDPRDYDRASYRSESRQITQDRSDAIEILGAVALRSYVTADHILQAAQHAFSGRLTITETAPGKFKVDYCTGQYWPTEYRKAAAAVLASAYWHAYSTELPPLYDGNQMRDFFRGEFGPAIQGRWFN
jgi:hypothetical protein